LRQNIWKNRFEIPDDAVDNDQNGYVDDFVGLNILTGNDQHKTLIHGTSVAGIIGAHGNNGLGISGVNWNVRIMLLSGTEHESELLEAYQYILDMRKRYNDSNGSEGAFVVATNLSAGINFAKPEDHPLWCAVYDQLGEEGILNACATTNSNTFVDEEGDMPTTCPSDFLIAVTNVDDEDEKVFNAGYGEIHIDLGAPGTSTLTTGLSDDYTSFPGTSAATPHVTGAIALLYSAPCDAFIEGARIDPKSTARMIKNFLLSGSDTISTLVDKSVSGGRLNVYNSLVLINEFCGGTSGNELRIESIYPNPAHETVNIRYETPDADVYTGRVYNTIGQQVLDFEIDPPLFGFKELSFTVSSFSPGVYFFSIQRDKSIISKRFVVY
jgi:subtilisin family serine protease